MQQQNHFIVHPSRFFVALVTFLCLSLIAITLLTMSAYKAAVIFFFIGLLFLPAAWLNGSIVSITDKNVYVHRLGHRGLSLEWNQVAEVGVAGSKIFNRRDKKKTGTLYIYLSPTHMSEEERFDMMLRFPPKEKIYLAYSEKRFEAIRHRWNDSIETWNTGEQRFDSK